ncbi:MAG: helix-turn-helix domain-containing protein [Candidatus Woesearchaeota archaeon]|jgi:sugar-specific transcriptional regulator TrmB
MGYEKELLEEMGLTDSERITYLALLELGDTTRSNLVKNTNISGSKIYDVLERLRRKGLATIYIKNKVKHFKPQNPKQLINFLDDKQEKIMNQKNKVELLLPELLRTFNLNKQDQEVELLIGLKSIRLFFNDQIEELKKGETNYVIGGTRGSDEQHVVAFFRRVHILRENKGIKTKMLYNMGQKDTVKKQYNSKEFKLSETKFIEHASAVSINIHKNKTLIMIFGKEITGIKITSEEIAHSFKEYFDLMWKDAK